MSVLAFGNDYTKKIRIYDVYCCWSDEVLKT